MENKARGIAERLLALELAVAELHAAVAAMKGERGGAVRERRRDEKGRPRIDSGASSGETG
jgi:hypothetical protein